MLQRKTIFNKKKHQNKKSIETDLPQTKRSQPSITQVRCETQRSSISFLKDQVSQEDSIIRKHELESNSNRRLNTDLMASKVKQNAFHLKQSQNTLENSETLLFIVIAFWILIVCERDFILVEMIISLYFCYDSVKKLQQPSTEFHINIVMHVLSGPFALIVGLAYYYRYGKVYCLSNILKSLKVLSSNYQRYNLHNIYSAFFNSLPIIFTSGILFSIFAYYFTIQYCKENQEYFRDFGTSAFTLLQILTLDDWGHIAKQLDQSLQTVALMFLFITIIVMFFWQLISAFQIDVLILDELFKRDKVTMKHNDNLFEHQDSFLFELLYGIYYTRTLLVIFAFHLILIEQQITQSLNFQLFTLLVSLLYTFHFVAIVILDKQNIVEMQSQYKKLQKFLHFISGPFAFIYFIYELNYFQYSSIAPILIMIKLATYSNSRNISYMAIIILGQSIPPYVTMIALTFLFLSITSSQSSNEISALLFYLQTLTLDDWSAHFQSQYIDQNNYLAALGYILYTLVCQFLLIPSFMAMAINTFQMILGVQFKVNYDINYNLFDPSQKWMLFPSSEIQNKTSQIKLNQDILYQLLKSQNYIFDIQDKRSIPLIRSTYHQLSSKKQSQQQQQLSSTEYHLLLGMQSQNQNQTQEVFILYKGQCIQIDKSQIIWNYM